jgi:hypothetical protein
VASQVSINYLEKNEADLRERRRYQKDFEREQQ